ncbi:MAG: hypothetical protein HOP06_10155 [Methylotenera sp.]|nr:hypothetical protein [Methylotenera sp.]
MATTQLTNAQIEAFNTTLKVRFNQGLVSVKETWQDVAARMGSNNASNTYSFLSQIPAFKLWVGSRLHKTFAKRAYTVTNERYENTFDIPRADFEDNNLEMYGDLSQSYGHSVIDLKNDLVFNAIKAGFSSICYDGQFFFDTDHPVTANEDGTGAVTAYSNMQAGTGEPWVLLCTDRAAKPLYLQERNAAEFYAKTNANNSDSVFETDVFSYGGRWRGNAAYGFWQLAFGSKAALDVTNFTAAFTAMMKVKGDGNRQIGVTPDVLVVGPDNMAAAELILKAQQNAAGATNINYNRVRLIVDPRMGA